jgi:hypothetical protein
MDLAISSGLMRKYIYPSSFSGKLKCYNRKKNYFCDDLRSLRLRIFTINYFPTAKL